MNTNSFIIKKLDLTPENINRTIMCIKQSTHIILDANEIFNFIEFENIIDIIFKQDFNQPIENVTIDDKIYPTILPPNITHLNLGMLLVTIKLIFLDTFIYKYNIYKE